jgi:lambda family phage portal protein
MSAAHIMQDGEAIGLVEWAEDETTPFKTRLRLVDPDRVSNPNGKPDGPFLRGGIERSAANIPTRYWIREGHPADLGGTANLRWNPWERFSTNHGRPQVLHAFDKLRAGQSRGVTRFVSVLKSFRSLSRFTDATIEAATVNALFVAFVKSNAGPAAVSESFESEDLSAFAAEREDYYKENPIDVGGATMPVLGLDDEVQMQTTARDTTGFDAFTRAVLRLIAAALGLTYEELSMDFSQTNYSSARAAMLIAWTETLALRGLIESQIAQPFHVAWLEEAFDSGMLKTPAGAPSFYDAMDAYAAGRWVGPGRGTIDPVKEIDAFTAKVEAGGGTLEDLCAELDGTDWEVIAEQRARERAKYHELGMPYPGDAPRPTTAPQDGQSELDRQSDARPASARARMHSLARDPAHAASLDARVSA